MGASNDPDERTVSVHVLRGRDSDWGDPDSRLSTSGGRVNAMALTLLEANRAIDGILSRARSLSLHVSASVCDPIGHLIAHQRMDGAPAESSWESMGKSLAAAQEGCPSGEILETFTPHPRTALLRAMGAPNLRQPGGLPIFRKGLLEGAVGVSGAPQNEQDDDCARAGIQALDLG